MNRLASMSRFADEDCKLRHRGERDEPETNMCLQPCQSPEETIAKFNVAFGTSYDVNAFANDAMELRNMEVHATEHNRPELAYLLRRHAEIAENEV